jgi:hypothetical protein
MTAEKEKLKMSEEDKIKILKQCFWDYDFEKLPIPELVNGNLDAIDQYKLNFITNRLLEKLNWYQLKDIFGVVNLKKVLTKERISQLRFVELQKKYEFIRKVLFNEAVSFTGWGDEYYKKIKHTLFSNRWYRFKQTLL